MSKIAAYLAYAAGLGALGLLAATNLGAGLAIGIVLLGGFGIGLMKRDAHRP